MSEDTLSKGGAALLDAARAAEPTLEPGARMRMREGLLGAIAVGAITTAAATTASAAPSAGIGAAASSSAAAGTTSIAPGAVVAAGLAKGVTASMLVKVALLVAATAAAGAIGTAVVRSRVPASLPVEGPVAQPPPPTAPSTAQAEPTGAPAIPAEHEAPSPSVVVAAPPPVPRVAPSPPKPAVAPEPRDPNEFTNEVASLDRARAALAAGDPARALTVLEAKSQSAAFAEERHALRIVALCAAGRREEGRRELARFRASFPRSLQMDRARRACDEAAPADPASGGGPP